uniref:Uncharacterized protein n=1 Tax=Caldilinea aerophila TaxID=133453 RepID=A0A7C1FIJ4_9CHLR
MEVIEEEKVMKQITVLLTSVLLLAACVASGAMLTEQGFCNRGLCTSITVEEPMEWGKPVTVNIIVTSDVDLMGAQISLTTFPPAMVQENSGWQPEGSRWLADLTAHQPLPFTKQVLLPSADIYELRANVYHPTKPFVVDIIEIEFTPEKIVINPTPAPYDGTPLLASTVPPEKVTTFEAQLTQEALLTPTRAFISPLATPVPLFVSPLPTPAPVAP